MPCTIAEAELDELHAAFLKYRQHDGCVSREDLQYILPRDDIDRTKWVESADGAGRFSLMEVISIVMNLWNDYKEVHRIFNVLDENGYGSVNREELKEGMIKIRGGQVPPDDVVNVMMAEADIDADGYINMRGLVGMILPELAAAEERFADSLPRISGSGPKVEFSDIVRAGSCTLDDYEEFVDAESTSPPTPRSDRSGPVQLSDSERTSIQKAFELMDSDSDGRLSWQELRIVLAGVVPDDTLLAWFQQADSDCDGLVSYSEFLDMIEI